MPTGLSCVSRTWRQAVAQHQIGRKVEPGVGQAEPHDTDFLDCVYNLTQLSVSFSKINLTESDAEHVARLAQVTTGIVSV
jgi:hypothetical protein